MIYFSLCHRSLSHQYTVKRLWDGVGTTDDYVCRDDTCQFPYLKFTRDLRCTSGHDREEGIISTVIGSINVSGCGVVEF